MSKPPSRLSSECVIEFDGVNNRVRHVPNNDVPITALDSECRNDVSDLASQVTALQLVANLAYTVLAVSPLTPDQDHSSPAPRAPLRELKHPHGRHPKSRVVMEVFIEQK